MKIAVFGWYNHNNAGDERIKTCLRYFFDKQGGIACVNFYDLGVAVKGKTNAYDHYDLVIIGGGGLILAQNNYHDFVNGINTKIVVLGISIELPKLIGNAKKFALALLDKSEIFLVRDRESANKLSPFDHSNKIEVSSDLTFLSPYETLSSLNSNIVGVNVFPKPSGFHYSVFGKPSFLYFLRLLTLFRLDHMVRFMDFKEIVATFESRFESVIPIPLYCESQPRNLPLYRKNDVTFLKRYFNDVSLEFDADLIDECSMFMSMRLHGAIFAVQKGVPVLSFSYLPKNRSFMREVGLEDYVLDTLDISCILNVVERVYNNESLIRDIMMNYKQHATDKIQNDMIRVLNKVL